MKNSIANIWILGLMIAFILLFACYIAITVDYSKTFKMKNEVLNIIEKNKGMTNFITLPAETSDFGGGNVYKAGTFQSINLYLAGHAYTAKGYCDSDEYTYGVKDIITLTDYSNYKTEFDTNFEVVKLSTATDGDKFAYCFSKHGTGFNHVYMSAYYTVRLFYKFEFPVLQEFFSIKVEGMTDEIFRPVDSQINGSDIIIVGNDFIRS